MAGKKSAKQATKKPQKRAGLKKAKAAPPKRGQKKSGAKSRVKSGAKTSAKSGAKTSAKSGAKTSAKSGARNSATSSSESAPPSRAPAAESLPPVRGRGRPSSFSDDLLPFLDLRSEGASFKAIAAAITAATGEPIAATTVKRWVQALEAGKDPRARGDSPTATDRINIYLTPTQREQLEDAVHVVRRGTGRQIKASAGTLARDLIQASFARGLLDDLRHVTGPESYSRALAGACAYCGAYEHSSSKHAQ